MNDDEKEFFRRNNFSSKSLLLRIYFSDIEKRSLNNRENLRWCAFAELSNFVRRLRRSHTFFVFLTSRRRREASRVCYFCVFCGSITSWPMPTTGCIGPTTCLNANFFFSFFLVVCFQFLIHYDVRLWSVDWHSTCPTVYRLNCQRISTFSFFLYQCNRLSRKLAHFSYRMHLSSCVCDWLNVRLYGVENEVSGWR